MTPKEAVCAFMDEWGHEMDNLGPDASSSDWENEAKHSLQINTEMSADLLEVIELAVEEEREACARMVDSRRAEVLARQYGDKDGFRANVDVNIRMIAVLLPELSEAIRKRGQQ